ncbi:hypothetical protein F4805DRAFT_445274 [Annulohypoxylon moriforme]|nr:hypothetical protein F4805DRAFT_445274 [Annulohypoxylon moriforme]
MQKSDLRRLSTPTQSLSRQPSSLYRSQPDGYSQRLAPLPPAHGYHPQTIWVPDYRPPLGGPRAVPMRMQRLTMNRTDTLPMPIPSMQLTSDRPYSVPNYHSSRKSKGNDDNFIRPPRPASTSEVDDIDKLVPRRQLSFLYRNTIQGDEGNSLASHENGPEDSEAHLRVPKTTRRVAKRGSQTSITNDSAKTGKPSEFNVSSKQDPSHPTGSQKRGNEHMTDEPNPSKRIKINVIRTQSQTPIVPEVTNQAYPNTRLRESQLNKSNYGKNDTTKEQINQNIEVDDDETESSESEDDTIEPAVISKRSRQTRVGKLDPYDIMDGASPLETTQDSRYFSKKRATLNVEETEPLDDLGGSGAISQESNTNSQRGRYTNASSQYDMSSEYTPRTSQVKPENKLSEHHQSATSIASVPSTQDERQGKPNEETLDARLSRIERAIHVQDEEGIDEFIKIKLNTGNLNTLGILTNEILLALIVPNDELLEQAIKIM